MELFSYLTIQHGTGLTSKDKVGRITEKIKLNRDRIEEIRTSETEYKILRKLNLKRLWKEELSLKTELNANGHHQNYLLELVKELLLWEAERLDSESEEFTGFKKSELERLTAEMSQMKREAERTTRALIEKDEQIEDVLGMSQNDVIDDAVESLEREIKVEEAKLTQAKLYDEIFSSIEAFDNKREEKKDD